MALPSSGAISLNQVNVELKKTATAAISMNDAAVRALAGKTSGAISMSNLHGKSSEVKFTNTTARKGANIHTLMGKPTAKGVYIFENTATISASAAGGTALSTGAFPAGSTLKIINKGAIRGGGGNGGSAGKAGGAGGTALVLNFPATIDNKGTIWGGGGGGGAGNYGAGGGAGMPGGKGGVGTYSDGKAGTATAGGAAASSSGAAGGGPGAAGKAGAGAGGRGGYSVQRNKHAVTWTAVGDRKGSVV